MVLTKEAALQVLEEAKSGGFWDGELPGEEDKVIELGEYYVKEARNAKENIAGMSRNKTVRAILNIYSVAIQEKSEKNFQEYAGVEIDSGLPIPEDMAGEPTPLPVDFTTIGDIQLRQLHGEYHAYLARARWLLAIAQNKLASATHLRDEAYRVAFQKEHINLELLGQRATKDVVDTAARGDSEYKEQNDLVKRHQGEVNIYKALVDIYEGGVDRLSRDWTMRTEEDKRRY